MNRMQCLNTSGTQAEFELLKFKEKMHDLVFSTEINAVVIHIKSDNGHVLYETNVEEAININSIRVKYTEADLSFYKKNNIYLIGRLVAFQDPLFAEKHPDSAVWDKKNNPSYSWCDFRIHLVSFVFIDRFN